ncbi:MAG: hypothetical protein EXS23_06955 [Pedosphaera sp.]|nr:hypothetical protein [Pedosphaera sp.]
MDQTETKIRSERRRGCVFYGCLSLLVLFVVGLLAVYIGAQFGLRKLAANYTSKTPLDISKVVYTPADMAVLEERVLKFIQAADQKNGNEPFELTARDLNALVQTKQPALEALGNFALELAPSEVRAQMSIPLDNLGRSAFKGRFLNGEMILGLALTNELLSLDVKSFTVKGKPLPAILVSQFQSKGFLASVNDNPQIQQLAARLSRIEIREGSVLLWPKAISR